MHTKPSLKNQLNFFIKRYWLAELVSACMSYLMAWVAINQGGDKILISYCGSAGAFIGFYSIILLNDIRNFPVNTGHSRVQILKSISLNLLIEFGLSEVIDVLLIRPACLYVAQLSINSFALAIIAGNIGANIIFFLLSAYMFSRKEAIAKWFSKLKNDSKLKSLF